MGRSLAARAWAKVERRGDYECWLWRGAVLRTGYGAISPNLRAHRVIYEAVHGLVPDGYDVCHTCDVRLCCNPSHLFAAPHKANMLDMARKERSPRRRLTRAQVDVIRSLWAAGGLTLSALGASFSVSRTQIRNIVSMQQWAA